MAAVESFQFEEIAEVVERPDLRLITTVREQWEPRRGRPLALRRTARARQLQRRRRTLVVLALVAGLVILSWPGHAFGSTTGAGLPSDLANSSILASGMEYVVQPSDTVNSIAAMMNPVSPAIARVALIHEIGSTVVVPGEHILIP